MSSEPALDQIDDELVDRDLSFRCFILDTPMERSRNLDGETNHGAVAGTVPIWRYLLPRSLLQAGPLPRATPQAIQAPLYLRWRCQGPARCKWPITVGSLHYLGRPHPLPLLSPDRDRGEGKAPFPSGPARGCAQPTLPRRPRERSFDDWGLGWVPYVGGSFASGTASAAALHNRGGSHQSGPATPSTAATNGRGPNNLASPFA